jgi:membrane associated rhomboid family serine protease
VGHLRSLAGSPAVLAIIAVLTGVFVAQLVNASVADGLSLPAETAVLGERPWSPLTVMFLHENVVHFGVMVLMLAAFGVRLEGVARWWDVVAVYVLAGLAGSFAVLAVAAGLETDETLVGASAAVFGVAAAVLARQPSERIFGGTPTQWLAMLVGINIVLLLTSPLSSAVHLVGLAVGFAYGRWLLTRSRPRAHELVG